MSVPVVGAASGVGVGVGAGAAGLGAGVPGGTLGDAAGAGAATAGGTGLFGLTVGAAGAPAGEVERQNPSQERKTRGDNDERVTSHDGGSYRRLSACRMLPF